MESGAGVRTTDWNFISMPRSLQRGITIPRGQKMSISATRNPIVDADEKEIRELVATWMAASKAGDTQTVLGLMADDVVFLVAGQPPMVGKAAYAAAATPQSNRESPHFDGRSEIQEIKVDGKWAVMWTKLTVVVTPP